MEDVTDCAFRRLVASCKRPDLFFTEFCSADGLFSRGRDNVIHRLHFTSQEKPIVAQIWGNNPDNYHKAGQLLEELGFDGIDINMGCPVGKIVKNGSCSGLIKNPPLAEVLFAALRQSCNIPISIKTRLGYDKFETERWCSFLLSLKPDALIVHGRIATELSQKPAKWSEIAKVVELRDQISPQTRIVGNGDVRSWQELVARYEETKVDGVMIGRGIFENPYIFDSQGIDFKSKTYELKLDLLLRHMELFQDTWGEQKPFRVIKKFFKIYAHGFREASKLRDQLVNAESFEEARELIRSYTRSYGGPLSPHTSTDEQK